jgi:hypothetical protein
MEVAIVDEGEFYQTWLSSFQHGEGDTTGVEGGDKTEDSDDSFEPSGSGSYVSTLSGSSSLGMVSSMEEDEVSGANVNCMCFTYDCLWVQLVWDSKNGTCCN